MTTKKKPILCTEVIQEMFLNFITEERDAIGNGGFMQLEVVSRFALAGLELLDGLNKLLEKRTCSIVYNEEYRAVRFHPLQYMAKDWEYYSLKFGFKSGEYFFNMALQFTDQIASCQANGVDERVQQVLRSRKKPFKSFILRESPEMSVFFETPRELEWLQLVLEEGTDEMLDTSRLKIETKVKFTFNCKNGAEKQLSYLLHPDWHLNTTYFFSNGTHLMDVNRWHRFIEHFVTLHRTNTKLEIFMMEIYWYLLNNDKCRFTDFQTLGLVINGLADLFPSLKHLTLNLEQEYDPMSPVGFVLFKTSITWWDRNVHCLENIPFTLEIALNYFYPDSMNYTFPAHLNLFFHNLHFKKDGKNKKYFKMIRQKLMLSVAVHPNYGHTKNVLTSDLDRKNGMLKQLGDRFTGVEAGRWFPLLFTVDPRR